MCSILQCGSNIGMKKNKLVALSLMKILSVANVVNLSEFAGYFGNINIVCHFETDIMNKNIYDI